MNTKLYKVSKILGSNISEINYINTVNQIINWALANESRIVYAANVHMLMEAYDSQDFRKIVNSADVATPDGMPLVWILRLKGIKKQERVYGPTLMLRVLDAAYRENIPIGFYGGSSGVLDLLVSNIKLKFPLLNLVYSYSPPFRPLTVEEDNEACRQMQDADVRILFVGLGCPKQEIWMAEHRGKINAVMVGVGAAFDFHAGSIPQAPYWMQVIGLEWLRRLIIEPRRLWKRYLIGNPLFIWRVFIHHILGFLIKD